MDLGSYNTNLAKSLDGLLTVGNINSHSSWFQCAQVSKPARWSWGGRGGGGGVDSGPPSLGFCFLRPQWKVPLRLLECVLGTTEGNRGREEVIISPNIY